MTRTAVRWLAAAMAAGLVLAGCGGDDGAGGGGESAGPTAVTVSETAGVPSNFVAFGVKKGFFEKEGLKVTLQTAQGGAATVPALVSGKVQIGGSNVVSLLIAASKGLPIQAIAPGTSAHGSGEKDFGALMVPKDSSVREVADLAGKTVAVNTLNNIAEVVVKASLQKAGVDPQQVKLAEVDFPEMGAALEKDDVDAAFVIEPFVTAEREASRIIDYSYVTTEPNMQVGAYAVSKQFAEQNPEAVESWRRAVAATAGYLTDHQDEFRTFMTEQAKTPAALAEGMQLPSFTSELNTESIERTAGLVQRFGLVDEKIAVDQLVGGTHAATGQ